MASLDDDEIGPWHEEDASDQFDGECTCEHDEDDHSWGSCDQLMDDGTVCECEAGWAE